MTLEKFEVPVRNPRRSTSKTFKQLYLAIKNRRVCCSLEICLYIGRGRGGEGERKERKRDRIFVLALVLQKVELRQKFLCYYVCSKYNRMKA